jgi:mRNA m6A methyltransferase non-catalytic subunit
MASVTATTNDLLAQHLVLISRLKESQKAHRRKLRTLPSPPLSILNLPTIPSPKPSPPPSPPSSPLLLPQRKPPRADLQPAKRARAIHYENYVPEEETIRNDYSQRYVDGGEWPQNWVLGAEPERRFEEFIHSCSRRLLLSSKHRLLVCAYLLLWPKPGSQQPLMQGVY